MATVTFSGHRGKPTFGFSRFVAALGTAWHNVTEARRSRREIATLASMPDYMLSDIGVSRATVDAALSQPFWIDPSKALVRGRIRNH